MSTKATVATLPECDIHKHERNEPNVTAHYDGKTVYGPWANMCQDCFDAYGVGLGTGKGQELTTIAEPRDVRGELMDAIDAGASLSDLEDIIGDGDICEFL